MYPWLKVILRELMKYNTFNDLIQNLEQFKKLKVMQEDVDTLIKTSTKFDQTTAANSDDESSKKLRLMDLANLGIEAGNFKIMHELNDAQIDAFEKLTAELSLSLRQPSQQLEDEKRLEDEITRLKKEVEKLEKKNQEDSISVLTKKVEKLEKEGLEKGVKKQSNVELAPKLKEQSEVKVENLAQELKALKEKENSELEKLQNAVDDLIKQVKELQIKPEIEEKKALGGCCSGKNNEQKRPRTL